MSTSSSTRENAAVASILYYSLSDARNEIVRDPLKFGMGVEVNPEGVGFGSYHPNVCLFLLGDGAVLPFNNTTVPRVIALLCTPNDGTTVTFP